MNIHEYQAKQLLAREGVVIPDGAVASSAEEARTVAEGLAKRGIDVSFSSLRSTQAGAAKAHSKAVCRAE